MALKKHRTTIRCKEIDVTQIITERRIELKTLYDISNEYKELLDLMQSAEVDEETIQDTIESTGLKDDFRNKIDGYLYVIDDLEASNKRIKNEENRLAERRRMQEKNIRKMKDMLTDTMQLLDIQKERTDRYTVWVQNNRTSVVIEDINKIPKEFLRETITVNKSSLEKVLKDKKVDGATLEQSKGVRFR